MAATIRRIEYFRTTVPDRAGEAYQLLSKLATERVNLLAFSSVPTGSERNQLVLFAEDVQRLLRAGERMGLALMGPEKAFLIQGDDELGALVDIHRKLFDVGVNVYASSGVTDGRGGYGYTLYVSPKDFERAARALGV